MTLGRAMVDDVRPFLVDANGQWNWTGNVGGANFLVYGTNTTDAFPEHQLGRIKTRYRATGPNLTDVIYSGITRDGKVQARIATQLGRTDDLVRAYYHLEYTFLEDVEYQRLAFFQMAADRYGDNGFTRHAYGNASGVLFDESIADHGTTGYASAADRGIELPGQNPWVMLYDNVRSDGNLPENLADIGFVVRDYQATIGSTVIDTPHINIRSAPSTEAGHRWPLNLAYRTSPATESSPLEVRFEQPWNTWFHRLTNSPTTDQVTISTRCPQPNIEVPT